MLEILDIVPGWVYAILLVMLGAFGVWEHGEVQTLTTASAIQAKLVAEREQQRSEAALQATEARSELTAYRLTHAQEVTNAVSAEKSKTAAAVAAGQHTRSLLVAATDALAARGRQGGGDPETLARAEQRADAFGVLLGQCDAVAESLGHNTEDLASQVRGLLDAYNSLSGLPGAALHPSADGGQVNPGFGLRWNSVMNTPQPNLSVKSSVDLGLGLTGKHAQVVP